MKSFIVKTEVGELILTLRYFPVSEKIKLYLHGVVINESNQITFYEDNATLFLNPNYESVLKGAKNLINYHFIWESSSQEEFAQWLSHLLSTESLEGI